MHSVCLSAPAAALPAVLPSLQALMCFCLNGSTDVNTTPAIAALAPCPALRALWFVEHRASSAWEEALVAAPRACSQLTRLELESNVRDEDAPLLQHVSDTQPQCATVCAVT